MDAAADGDVLRGMVEFVARSDSIRIGSDAALVQRQLAAQPPQAIIMPAWQWRPDAQPPRGDALAVQQGLAAWWAALPQTYREVPLPTVSRWVLLVK